jgi:hypothetical protein
MKRLTIRGIAITAIALLVLSLLAQFSQWLSSGSFTADTYYLPVRAFVPVEQQPAMEDKVIEIHQRQATWRFKIYAPIDMLALIAIVLLLNQLLRESPGASTGASPHSAN